jgi:hypothetical protein
LKIDAKMAPKSHQKSMKIGHWGTPESIFSVFNGFWAVSKKHDFSMPIPGVKKRAKSVHGAPRGRKTRSDALQGDGSGAEGLPATA